jgi:hypothetical protein
VCDAMAHEAASRASAPSGAGSHENHTAAPSDSQHHSDHPTPLDHCTGTTSCAGLVLTAEILGDTIDFPHSDRVVLLSAIIPNSQSPDLEPPPPKA